MPDTVHRHWMGYSQHCAGQPTVGVYRGDETIGPTRKDFEPFDRLIRRASRAAPLDDQSAYSKAWRTIDDDKGGRDVGILDACCQK